MIAALLSLVVAAAPADDGRIGIAVMDIATDGKSADDAELAKAAAAVVAGEMARTGAVRVITAEDVRRMLAFEAQKQDSGCLGDASCLAELGNALGVPYLWSGTMSRVGGNVVLALSLLDLKAASPIARDTVRASTAAQVLDELKPATSRMLEPVLRLEAGSLDVRASEEGATVSIDDVVMGTTPLDTPLSTAGRRRVTVEKSGFVKSVTDVVVDPKSEVVLDVKLAPSREFLANYRARATTTRIAAWGTLAGGVLAAAGGGALFYANAARADELKQDGGGLISASEQQTFLARDVGGFTLAGLGAALAATSVFLFVTGDDPSRYDGVSPDSTSTVR